MEAIELNVLHLKSPDVYHVYLIVKDAWALQPHIIGTEREYRSGRIEKDPWSGNIRVNLRLFPFDTKRQQRNERIELTRDEIEFTAAGIVKYLYSAGWYGYYREEYMRWREEGWYV